MSIDSVQIDYPFRFDRRGRTAGCSEDAHVRDMIEQLLFTNPGERVNRPEFGSGLLQMVFAPNSPELAAALQFTVHASLQRWLGDVVDVNSLEVDATDSTVRVALAYTLRATGEARSDTFERSVP